MIVIFFFFFFNFFFIFHKISLGTSVRGDTEKCSLSLVKTEFKQWLTTAGPAHYTISVFHPQRSLHLISFMPLQSHAAHRERARERRFLFQVESHGKHGQSLMGRERSSKVQPRLWEALGHPSSATAKGTREVQTRKAVQASLPAIFCSDTNIWCFPSSLQSLPRAR